MTPDRVRACFSHLALVAALCWLILPATRTATYHVNYNSTVNDEWCTAAGSNGNDGLSPGTPKASVEAILAAYDLEPGDVVRIDTGTYVETANIAPYGTCGRFREIYRA